MKPDVVVIGAGCAGLAAATALVEAGASVEVLEALAAEGGRARSWVDPESNELEDNGQHLVLACYDELLRFLRRTGGVEGMEFQERLEVVLLEPGGRVARFRPGPFPAPLDLASGLLGLRGFPWGDVRRLRRIARAELPASETTVTEWLSEHGQSEAAQRVFWTPLALATLNLDPRAASARPFARMLRRAFERGSLGSRIGFPRRGLGPVLVEPALRYLHERGGRVLRRHAVGALELERGSFAAARLKDGSRRVAGSAVLAVPHREAARLLPRQAVTFEPGELERLGASPIVAIHLWFDREVSPHAFAGLLDSPIHWVFERSRVAEARAPGSLALVSSAAHDLATRTREQLLRIGRSELERFFPQARGAKLLRARVLKERLATPMLAPANESLRPRASTEVANLVLAGDWIDTGLPATLEGAAASGHRAASLLLRRANGSCAAALEAEARG